MLERRSDQPGIPLVDTAADNPALVILAEYPSVSLTCQWDDRSRQRIGSHMTKAMTWGVTKPMT
jgi:hypothetical protein